MRQRHPITVLLTLLVLPTTLLAHEAPVTADADCLLRVDLPLEANLLDTPRSPDGDPTLATWVLPADSLAFERTIFEAPRANTTRGTSTVFIPTGTDPEGDAPTSSVFTLDGSTILVAHRDSQNVIAYDAATQAFLYAIPVNGTPFDIAIAPDNQTVVTANLTTNTISIIDLNTQSVVATVPVGFGPAIVQITPDATRAIVGNGLEGSISVVDLATATELRRIPGLNYTYLFAAAPEPGAVQITFDKFVVPLNNLAIVPDQSNDRLAFVNLNAGSINFVACDDSPRQITITPGGVTAVVSHTGTANVISVIDTATQAITNVWNVGTRPSGPISVNPSGTKAAVAVLNATRVVNLITGAVTANLNTVSVNQLLTTGNGQYALGVGFFGSLIDYNTETIVANLNNRVSCAHGSASPVGFRAAMFSTTFGEDMLVFNTNGGSGSLEFYGPSGPAPEADVCRTVAVSADGSQVAGVHIFSDNAVIVDDTNAITTIGATGERPSGVAFTPDGSKLVVANLDSFFASVIDTATGNTTNVGMGRRGSEVTISPDGAYAYIPVVADGDGVYRINLNTLALDGPKLLTGNMGSVGFAYTQSSGIALSHDGATLAVCGSFDDNITLINTASWSVITNVPVGDFPVRAIFSPDDSRIYVSNRDNDTVSVVANNGAASTVLATIPVGDQPFELAVTPDNGKLYVIEFAARTVGVINLATNTRVNTLPLPYTPVGLALDGAANRLYVADSTSTISFGPAGYVTNQDGEIAVYDTTTDGFVEALQTGKSAAALAASADAKVLGIASPAGDGLVVTRFAVACAGDLSGDNQVNLTDLGLLFGCWQQPCGDLSGDGNTDLVDLGLLFADWNCGV